MIPILQLDVSRGYTAQGGGRVEKERDNTNRGSNNRDTTGRKRRQPHRLRMVRSRTNANEVVPEKGDCHIIHARDTRGLKQQILNVVAFSVFPGRLSPSIRSKTRT